MFRKKHFFSDRQKRKEGLLKKDLIFASVPKEARMQLLYLINEFNQKFLEEVYSFVGRDQKERACEEIEYEILKHYGWEKLPLDLDHVYASDRLRDYLLNCELNPLFDFLELYFSYFRDRTNGIIGEPYSHSYSYKRDEWTKICRAMIENVNFIFDKHSVGYEVINFEIQRKGSEYLKKEVIDKAYSLLKCEDFDGALEEFEKARTYLEDRHKQDFKNAIKEANSAVESAMKQILGTQKGTADELLKQLINNNIVPPYFKEKIRPLFQLVSIIRNNKGGHGQGKKREESLRPLAEFAVNLAGTCIIYLINIYKNK